MEERDLALTDVPPRAQVWTQRLVEAAASGNRQAVGLFPAVRADGRVAWLIGVIDRGAAGPFLGAEVFTSDEHAAGYVVPESHEAEQALLRRIRNNEEA